MFRFIILLCFHIFTSVYTFSSQNSFNSRLTSSDHNSSLQENRNQSVVIEISEINSANQSALHSQTETQEYHPATLYPRSRPLNLQDEHPLHQAANNTDMDQELQLYRNSCLQSLNDLNSRLESLKNPHSPSQYLQDLRSSLQSLNNLYSGLQSLNNLNSQLQSLNEALPSHLQADELFLYQYQAYQYSCFLFYDFCYRFVCPVSVIGVILLITYMFQ